MSCRTGSSIGNGQTFFPNIQLRRVITRLVIQTQIKYCCIERREDAGLEIKKARNRCEIIEDECGDRTLLT